MADTRTFVSITTRITSSSPADPNEPLVIIDSPVHNLAELCPGMSIHTANHKN